MTTKLHMSAYKNLYESIEKTLHDGLLDPYGIEDVDDEDLAVVIQRIMFLCGYDLDTEQEEQ